MEYEFLPHENFLGVDETQHTLEAAGVLVLPIPYEGTVSYGGGTRFGPRAILHASMQVELYDREFDEECAERYRVHTLPPLATNHGSPERMIGQIEHVVARLMTTHPGKFLFVVGGEHSISSGVGKGLARALDAEAPLLVQLDAHADLRASYEGTPFSHASVAHRLLEDGWELVQLGIRSVSREEMEVIAQHENRIRTWFIEEIRQDAGWRRELARRVRGRDVFLSIDVDGLDPSIVPGTGTPEPNGLGWEEAVEIVRILARNAGRVLGADCVELAPIPGQHLSEFVTAKLIYKTMNILMDSRARSHSPGAAG